VQLSATTDRTLVMSRGKRFESARRLSVLFALALRHEAEKPRLATFGEGSELEHDDLASMHNCINTEVRFRALLTEGGDPRVQLHRA
jgi:hypothetical protein